MRQKAPAEPSDDESMEAETDEQKTQRYANCGMSVASDPDFWQELHYGPLPPTPAEYWTYGVLTAECGREQHMKWSVTG